MGESMRIKKCLAALLCMGLLAGAAAPAASAAMLYRPGEGYFYNTRSSPQWIFGFNGVYDALTFLAAAHVDTLHCKFTYGGRDWLVQIWKGAYAGALAVGGEIGVYTKPQGAPVEHYASALPGDWLGMEMSIYAGGRQLFTHPFGRHWWCTGYRVGRLEGFRSVPRENCAMVSRVQLKDAPMAALFADTLASKGFRAVKQPPAVSTPEAYCIQDDTVYFSWRSISESCY